MSEHGAVRKSILVELRPALDGFSGIPQESRLLYGELCKSGIYQINGFLQTSFMLIPDGIDDAEVLEPNEKYNKLSKVIHALSVQTKTNIVVQTFRFIQRRIAASRELIKILVSNSSYMRSTLFNPVGFEDFIWQRLFKKTLHPRYYGPVTSAHIRLMRFPWGVAQIVGAWAWRLFGKVHYPRINTEAFDYFIAQTPFPGKISSGTTLVVRYHDAIPIFLPHTIAHQKKHHFNHYHALKSNVENGAVFACISEATRQDLISVFPSAADRSYTIHNMVSNQYVNEEQNIEHARCIIRSNLTNHNPLFNPEFQSTAEKNEFYASSLGSESAYLLMVSTLEPRKNHLALIKACREIRQNGYKHLKLVLVGSDGWNSDDLLQEMKCDIELGNLFILNKVPADELRVLYRNALLTVCPSLAEGFDYSGIEAMMSGGVVIASDIPVHREVYADAAYYFDPYDHQSLAAGIEFLLSSEGMVSVEQLRLRSKLQSRKYTPENIMAEWERLFSSLKKK